MNKIVKLQLLLFILFAVYFIVRFLSTPFFGFSFWPQVYQTHFIRFSLALLFSISLTYTIFNTLRHNPKLGPTIIKASILKKGLYLTTIIWWLAVIIWMLTDGLKIIFPFQQLPFYSLLNFLDETIGHIFMFLSIITFIILGLFLEIERPFQLSLVKKERFLVSLLASISGIMWGLNLTEGRLSQFTSLPVMLALLFLIVFLKQKYHLSYSNRPWSLFAFIFYITSSLSFTAWGLFFHSFPELFNYLKQL